MVLRERPYTQDEYHWECLACRCRKRRSIRAGSFFENSKIPLAHWLYVIFLWSIEVQSKKVVMLTGLLLRTVTTALQALRNICSLKILHGHIKLGVHGETVEIDESMFGHKRKYNRGRISKGTWVFGSVWGALQNYPITIDPLLVMVTLGLLFTLEAEHGRESKEICEKQ